MVEVDCEVAVFIPGKLKIRAKDLYDQLFELEFRWGRYIPPAPPTTTETSTGTTSIDTETTDGEETEVMYVWVRKKCFLSHLS